MTSTETPAAKEKSTKMDTDNPITENIELKGNETETVMRNDPPPKVPINKLGKSVRKRFTSIVKSVPRDSWKEKMAAKVNAKTVKTFESKIIAKRVERTQELKRRREESKKKREANERRSEVVVPIRNTAKIKRMNKKEKKKLRKADID